MLWSRKRTWLRQLCVERKRGKPISSVGSANLLSTSQLSIELRPIVAVLREKRNRSRGLLYWGLLYTVISWLQTIWRYTLCDSTLYHGLRGSGDWLSPWEMALFDSLQNRHPSTDHQNICHRWLHQRPLYRAVPNLVHIRPWGASGRMGEVWPNFYLFIYLCPFWELSYRSHRSTDYHAWWFKRRGLAQGCAFLGVVDVAFHLGVKSPKTAILGAWIGVFKPNSRNRKTHILSELLHRFQPNFAQR